MERTMDKIIALAKARGFVYPGSEIYGGLANTWDYGNLGVELKNNVKRAWWQKFIQESPYNVGVDCAILMNPQTWVASGHLGSFSDPLMDCKECHERFRADKIIEDFIWLLDGLKTTLIITVFAVIVGLIIGFLVAIIRSAHDKSGSFKILNAICRVYLTVIRGTPTMIQLLIMNFVIFGAVSINKIIVGGLAFGINSGAYVAEIVRSGIMSIDQGQTEAGRSLGTSSSVPEKRPPPAPSNLSPNAASAGRAMAPL